MNTLVNAGNVNDAIRILLEAPQGSPISVDCETTGLKPYQGDVLRGFSYALRFQGTGPIHSFYVPVGYPENNLSSDRVQALSGAIKSVDPIYVYHHSKFDLRFLRQLPKLGNGGVAFPVPAEHKLWDTKIVAWLIDENLSNSLDPQAKLHLDAEKSSYMIDLVWKLGKEALQAEGIKRPLKGACLDRGWSLVTAADTAEYGGQDAVLTLRLREVQIALLSHPMTYGNPTADIEREHAVQRLLLRMEDNGIQVDRGALDKLLASVEGKCEDIEKMFMDDYAVNVGSTQQVAELLFGTLAMDDPVGHAPAKQDFPNGDWKPPVEHKHKSTAKNVLEGLVQNEVVVAIQDHRSLKKAASGYLHPMHGLVAPDGRIHPTFWQTGTVTGRFSCSDPNLQTIPREDKLPGIRSLFTAPEGYELWSYDLAAAEMRVVAGMAPEPVLIEGINAGWDMHARLAEEVFGPNWTGIQRRYAKNIGYGFFYGLTSPTTASKYIGGPDGIKLAVKILTGLKEMYPNVVRLMKRTQREAEKLGYVKIHDTAWPGRYRRFVTEAEQKPYAYTALNAKVQGGIGEMMKDVMLAAEPHLDIVGARLDLQVHDELVIEVPIGYGPEVLCSLQYVLDKVNPFDMPMVFTGKPWSEHE